MREDLRRLPPVVWATGAVSFFTDISSEMIYCLLPFFMTVVLQASRSTLGLVEGVAEAVACLLRLWGGARTDRLGHYKPLILRGYGVSVVARPMMALATSPAHVLGLRVVDRIGKGVRGPPRDALVARVVDPAQRGLAFGVQRALDNAGAVVGPLAAALLLHLGADIRGVFAIALIPGLLSIGTIARFIQDPQRAAPDPAGGGSAADNATISAGADRGSPPPPW